MHTNIVGKSRMSEMGAAAMAPKLYREAEIEKARKKKCSNQMIVMSYYLKTTLGEASAQNTSGGQRSK